MAYTLPNSFQRPAQVIIVDATAVAPQPWKNGGGQTRELLRWPDNDDWRLRISQADIEADGPFSVFSQVWRWTAVIRGEGVVLTFAEGEHRLRCGDAPLSFDGGEAPGCRLLGGPVRDLNLMARGGSSLMRCVANGQAWDQRFAWRGLYTAGPGRWSSAGQEQAVAAHCLLWSEEPGGGAWMFIPDETDEPPRAWWLGYTPHILFV